eukprot:761682-Hanusia_phi.AAC.2
MCVGLADSCEALGGEDRKLAPCFWRSCCRSCWFNLSSEVAKLCSLPCQRCILAIDERSRLFMARSDCDTELASSPRVDSCLPA